MELPLLGIQGNDPGYTISAQAGERTVAPIPVETVVPLGSAKDTILTYNPPLANATVNPNPKP